jgi:tRNA pseudouridine55 synthase
MDGVILCDKPPGKTSHDIVAMIRREAGGVKTGHAGTLDPFASGLLLVLLGRATRIQRFLMALPKTYVAVARLGAVSTTGDPEGEITETGVLPPDPLVLPTGEIRQRPPAHSAIRVDGERAYRRARRGEDVEMPERKITVHRFVERRRAGDRAEFEIECSSGTYVRSLIAALGDAYCLELRRTAIGPFSVSDADGRTIVGLDAALGFLPELALGEEDARRAAHGRAVPGVADGHVRLTDDAGLIAIGEGRDDGEVKPVVGFRGS